MLFSKSDVFIVNQIVNQKHKKKKKVTKCLYMW